MDSPEVITWESSIPMVSPKIRFYYAPDTIQYAGYTPFSPVTLRQHLIGYREKDSGQYDQARETFSIHGAAMMVPRSVVKEVGMMSELYFLYYEEHDWVERIKRAGYKIFYVPESLVFHKESISTGKESQLKTYYITRNRFKLISNPGDLQMLQGFPGGQWLKKYFLFTRNWAENRNKHTP